MLSLGEILKDIAFVTHGLVRNAQHWNGDMTQESAIEKLDAVINAIEDNMRDESDATTPAVSGE